jgi:hypothetical protein
MGRCQHEQLEFSFLSGRGDEACFTLTKPLARHRSCRTLLEKLHYVRRFFPELHGKSIKVGLTHAASGLAVPGGIEVWFNPFQLSYHTIAHEFVHILQGTDRIPTGERSCDVFALARHWTLNDSPPTYIKIPKSFHDTAGHIHEDHARTLFTVAASAIAQRRRGLRNYIAFFENELSRLEGESSSILRLTEKQHL